MTIVLLEDIITSCPSMLIAVQYTILLSSFIFPVYVSTLEDITLSSLQLVLQTSDCGEAEVVIFVVDKYHCIILDGRAAFVVQENVWSLFEATSTGFVSVGVDNSVANDTGTERKWWHLTIICFTWFWVSLAVMMLHISQVYWWGSCSTPWKLIDTSIKQVFWKVLCANIIKMAILSKTKIMLLPTSM